MNIFKRRFLVISFAVIYLILAPALIFYAAGWRYNIRTKNVERAGAILVETEPRGATVVLNGVEQPKKTPMTIKNVLTDEYTVTIKKEGYHDWTTMAKVTSRETSKVTEVHLLEKETTVIHSVVDGVIDVQQSPDQDLIAVYSDTILSIFQISSLDIILQKKIQKQITEISWSADQKKLLLRHNDNSYSLLDMGDKTVKLLDSLYEMPIQNAWWSQDEKDILYATTNEKLYRINIFQNTVTELIAIENIIGMSGDYMLQKYNERIRILTLDGEPTSNTTMANFDNFSVLNVSKQLTLIHDQDNQNLYVFHRDNNSLEKLDDVVKDIIINQDDFILYNNDHEIFMWNWKINEKELILRTSDTVSHAHWIQSDRYILYQHNTSLQAIEVRSPNRNTYPIDIGSVEKIFTTTDGNHAIILTHNKVYQLSF